MLYRLINVLKKNCFSQAVLIAIAASGFMVVYIEAFPFLGVIFSVLVFAVYQQNLNEILIFEVLLLAFLMSLLVLSLYRLHIILYVAKQASVGVAGHGHIFPYFLAPSGIANLWGLQAFANIPAEPRLSITIGAHYYFNQNNPVSPYLLEKDYFSHRKLCRP